MPEFKNYEKKNSIHMESCLDILDSHHLRPLGRQRAALTVALDAGIEGRCEGRPLAPKRAEVLGTFPGLVSRY